MSDSGRQAAEVLGALTEVREMAEQVLARLRGARMLLVAALAGCGGAEPRPAAPSVALVESALVAAESEARQPCLGLDRAGAGGRADRATADRPRWTEQ